MEKKHFDAGTKVIRCNWCDHIFPADALLEDKEEGRKYCPDCEEEGIEEVGTFVITSDITLFPILSKCRDWKTVKDNCSLDTLCYFENEIYDYDYYKGGYANGYEDYPSIVQWYEGIMDTAELLDFYGEHNW